MKSRPEILDEIMFYIFERARCEEDPDKYLEYVADYCKKDYQQAYKKLNGLELTMDIIQEHSEKHNNKRLVISSLLEPKRNEGVFPLC